MDYHDQHRGEDTYAYSPNDAYIHGYTYWGNLPDPYSLPSYVHTQSSHAHYRYDVFKHGDLYRHDHAESLGSPIRTKYSQSRHRATAGAPGGYDTERHPPTTPARLASGTGDQPKARKRYTPYSQRVFIGKAFGNHNRAPLEGDKPLSMLFEDDPSLYLEAALPQIPEDFDGLTIGSFVGNLNSGLLGEKGELVMTYRPQRVCKTGMCPSSPVGAYNDSRSRSRGQQSPHGFTMFPPSSTQTATSTLPVYRQEQSLGQAPSAEQYGQNRRG